MQPTRPPATFFARDLFGGEISVLIQYPCGYSDVLRLTIAQIFNRSIFLGEIYVR